MATVTEYHVTVYGNPTGFQNARADITLLGEDGTLGILRFHDEKMVFPDDSENAAGAFMHLPTSMLPTVIDLLRWEKPVFFQFQGGHGTFSTGTEPVGEEESSK